MIVCLYGKVGKYGCVLWKVMDVESLVIKLTSYG
jgi:hypothetical protein